jgi:hypothetical protein
VQFQTFSPQTSTARASAPSASASSCSISARSPASSRDSGTTMRFTISEPKKKAPLKSGVTARQTTSSRMKTTRIAARKGVADKL